MNVERNLLAADAAAATGYGGRLTSRLGGGGAQELARLGAGLGLAALFGLALGARAGGRALLEHALGVPLGLLIVGAVAVPSLFVVLAILDAPITPSKMFAATARSLASTGLVLSGLAPATAMLAVTITTPGAAAQVARLAFSLAGAIGLSVLVAGVREPLREADEGLRRKAFFALCGFCVIATALAGRIWEALLPILGGAS